jgi:hypothetical protein
VRQSATPPAALESLAVILNPSDDLRINAVKNLAAR